MSRKRDTISYKEFNQLTDHTNVHHDPLPSEVAYDDENENRMEETLMGMEYDAEDLDELEDEEDNEIALELSAEEIEDGDEEATDLEADIDDEEDESSYYEGRPM